MSSLAACLLVGDAHMRLVCCADRGQSEVQSLPSTFVAKKSTSSLRYVRTVQADQKYSALNKKRQYTAQLPVPCEARRENPHLPVGQNPDLESFSGGG
jgi:hypothetical protein